MRTIPKLLEYKGYICSLIAIKPKYILYKFAISSRSTRYLVLRKNVMIDWILDGLPSNNYEIFLEDDDIGRIVWFYADRIKALLHAQES